MPRAAGESPFYTLSVLGNGSPVGAPIYLPSVTSVTRLMNKVALVPWGFKLGVQGVQELVADHGVEVLDAEYLDIRAALKNSGWTPEAKMEAGAARGKKVHQVAEDLALGKTTVNKVRRGMSKFDEEVQPYVQALLGWWSKEVSDGMEIIAAERVVVSLAHRFAGTMDLFCNRDGLRYLIDFKTSESGRSYPEHQIQLGGYDLALRETLGTVPDRGSIVVLSPEGVREEIVDTPRHEEFLGLLKVFNYLWSSGVIKTPKAEAA